MSPIRFCSICFIFLLSLTRLAADPINFMVGDLTFTRPPSWEWVDSPPSQRVAAQLRVVDSATKTNLLVTFTQPQGTNAPTTEQIITLWRSSFVSPTGGEASWKTNVLKFKDHRVTLLEVEGDHRISVKGEVKSVRSNRAFLGASVESKSHRIFFVYTIGPQTLIQKTKASFKEMIESPFKDE